MPMLVGPFIAVLRHQHYPRAHFARQGPRPKNDDQSFPTHSAI